jgi:hypothetical protein
MTEFYGAHTANSMPMSELRNIFAQFVRLKVCGEATKLEGETTHYFFVACVATGI